MKLSLEIQYLILLFVLFVIPKIMQRYRIPSAIVCVVFGIILGLGFDLFQNDATIQLLATFGIVTLFLYHISTIIFGGIIVYALINTMFPSLILHLPIPEFETQHID